MSIPKNNVSFFWKNVDREDFSEIKGNILIVLEWWRIWENVSIFCFNGANHGVFSFKRLVELTFSAKFINIFMSYITMIFTD